MNKYPKIVTLDQGYFYRVTIQGNTGHVLTGWSDKEEISIEDKCENGWISTLEGYFPDQAALHGLLNNLYALGLPLISVQRLNKSS